MSTSSPISASVRRPFAMMRRRASRCQSGRSFGQSRIVSRTVFCGAAGFCISCSSVALQDDGKAPLGVRIELLGGALQELVTANLGRSGFAHNHAFETPIVEN